MIWSTQAGSTFIVTGSANRNISTFLSLCLVRNLSGRISDLPTACLPAGRDRQARFACGNDTKRNIQIMKAPAVETAGAFTIIAAAAIKKAGIPRLFRSAIHLIYFFLFCSSPAFLGCSGPAGGVSFFSVPSETFAKCILVDFHLIIFLQLRKVLIKSPFLFFS